MNFIPTPLPALNQQLGGGIHCRKLTHVFGAPGSGKTTFCLQLATGLMARRYDVLWIDCNNSFSLTKLHELATPGALPYFSLIRIRDWEQFQQVFANVRALVHRTMRLVVLDNFAYFYGLSAPQERHELRELLFDEYLQSFVRLYRKEKYDLAVIIINQVRADFKSGGVRPVARTEFELACQTHILFEIDGDAETSKGRKVSLLQEDLEEVLHASSSKITARGFEVV